MNEVKHNKYVFAIEMTEKHRNPQKKDGSVENLRRQRKRKVDRGEEHLILPVLFSLQTRLSMYNVP